METTKKKRTREEVRAAVRETIRRKKEWIEKTNKEFEMIRNGELKVEQLSFHQKPFITMNTLSLENINKHAPYGVRHRENRTASGMTKGRRSA